jgi:hypothetical protein
MQLFDSVSRWFADNPVLRRTRLLPRVGVDEQALIRVSDGDEPNHVLLRDISPGGACIRTDLRLAKGDSVWICVNAGSEEQFELTATVVAIRPQSAGFFTDYGLRLVQLDVDSARVLGDFIEHKLTGEPRR